MAKHALNTKTKSKTTISKIFTTTLAVVLFSVLALTSLAAAQVAIGPSSTVPRYPVTLQKVTFSEIFQPDLTVPATTPAGMSFAALKLTSTRDSRDGVIDGYQWSVQTSPTTTYLTPTLWVLLKNMTSGGAAWTGTLIYQNSDGVYTVVRNYSATGNPPVGYWGTGGVTASSTWVVPIAFEDITTGGLSTRAKVEMLNIRGPGSTKKPTVIKVLTTIPEFYGNWNVYLKFSSASSSEAVFRNSFASTSTNKVTFVHSPYGGSAAVSKLVSALPFCSPFGSCVKPTDFTPSVVTIRIAGAQQSLD